MPNTKSTKTAKLSPAQMRHLEAMVARVMRLKRLDRPRAALHLAGLMSYVQRVKRIRQRFPALLKGSTPKVARQIIQRLAAATGTARLGRRDLCIAALRRMAAER